MFTLVVACKFVQSASQTKYGAVRGLAVETCWNGLESYLENNASDLNHINKLRGSVSQ